MVAAPVVAAAVASHLMSPTSSSPSWANRSSKRACRQVAEEGGRRVSVGDPLVELETEKIDLEVSADRAGVLASIKHQEGADVKVGEVLACSKKPLGGGRAKAPERRTSQAPRRRSRPASAVRPTCEGDADREKRRPCADVNIEPSRPTAGAQSRSRTWLRRRRARAGAGSPGSRPMPQGTKHPQAPRASPSPKHPSPARRARETRERMSKRRATIARRLVEAQHNAAMLTTFNEVDMTAA